MRARLKTMARSQEYQFVCAEDMVGKIDRVVTFSGGVIQAREIVPEGIVITAIKAE